MALEGGLQVGPFGSFFGNCFALGPYHIKVFIALKEPSPYLHKYENVHDHFTGQWTLCNVIAILSCKVKLVK